MEDADIPTEAAPSDWQPIADKHHIAVLGKLGEELGELVSVKDRCLIQGLDGIDPDSGKVNRNALEDEIADVLAMISHTVKRFGLDEYRISHRSVRKHSYKAKWFDELAWQVRMHQAPGA